MSNSNHAGTAMSFNHFSVPRLLLGLSALAMIGGCEDAIAPLPSASSEPVPSLRASRDSKAARDLIKDQYIVVFRDGYNDVDARSKRLVARTKGKLGKTFKSGVRGFSAGMTADEAAVIATDPSVAYVEQDQVVTIGVGKPGGTTTTRPRKGTTTTLEPGTFLQSPVPSWGIDRIDQATNSMDNKYTYTATGAGVNVYIIDSGIKTTHAEFEGRATADFDLVGDGYGATGCNWHGTHVAGTVGGVTAGVAKKALLHSVRILDCNAAGSVSGAVAGIDWVIANRVMPAVINLSVAAGSSAVLTEAVDRAVAAGITVVAAAGNSAADACGYSPANAASAITVGATNTGDQMAEFSNQGSCVDLMAPGDAIMSAATTDNTSLQYGSGTSMAAPHVAGAAALYLEKNPLAVPSAVTQDILLRANAGLIGGLALGSPNLLLRTY